MRSGEKTPMTLEELNARCNYNTRNGIWILARTPGRCTVEIRVTEHSCNPYGFVHGGLLFSACDTAACVSAMEEDPAAELMITQSGSLNFLRPGMGDRLRVEAECVYRGAHSALSRVSVYSEEGKLLSSGEFRVAIRPAE